MERDRRSQKRTSDNEFEENIMLIKRRIITNHLILTVPNTKLIRDFTILNNRRFLFIVKMKNDC